MEDMNDALWRTASYSGNDGGNCIEVGRGDTSTILVRDTKDRDGALLQFSAEAWRRFLATAH